MLPPKKTFETRLPEPRDCQRFERWDVLPAEDGTMAKLSVYALVDGAGKREVGFYLMRQILTSDEARTLAGVILEAADAADSMHPPPLRLKGEE